MQDQVRLFESDFSKKRVRERTPDWNASFILFTGNTNWFEKLGQALRSESAAISLSTSEVYSGTDQIHMGNGAGFTILHTGSSIISSPLKPLFLNNLLHVPNIYKNILSLSLPETMIFLLNGHLLAVLLRIDQHRRSCSLAFSINVQAPSFFIGRKYWVK